MHPDDPPVYIEDGRSSGPGLLDVVQGVLRVILQPGLIDIDDHPVQQLQLLRPAAGMVDQADPVVHLRGSRLERQITHALGRLAGHPHRRPDLILTGRETFLRYKAEFLGSRHQFAHSALEVTADDGRARLVRRADDISASNQKIVPDKKPCAAAAAGQLDEQHRLSAAQGFLQEADMLRPGGRQVSHGRRGLFPWRGRLGWPRPGGASRLLLGQRHLQPRIRRLVQQRSFEQVADAAAPCSSRQDVVPVERRQLTELDADGVQPRRGHQLARRLDGRVEGCEHAGEDREPRVQRAHAAVARARAGAADDQIGGAAGWPGR